MCVCLHIESSPLMYTTRSHSSHEEMTKYKDKGNKNVDIKFSAHDAFLE
jgi:hypothetical protein